MQNFKITGTHGFQINTKQGLPLPYKIRSFKNIHEYIVYSFLINTYMYYCNIRSNV